VFNFFNLPNHLGFERPGARRMLNTKAGVDGFSFSWRSHPYTLTVKNPCGELGAAADASPFLDAFSKAKANLLMTLSSGMTMSKVIASVTNTDT
jgi:hypothetical protein